jgi:uncharacterized OB-fold protein
VRLAYRVIAGRDLSRFLAGIAEGRFVGKRCPSCRKVYVPPRGACPACGVALDEEVAVADRGTVTTFCVVNIAVRDGGSAPKPPAQPLEGRDLPLPYVYGSVLLDGADIPFAHLVRGLPVEHVHMGLRVRAEWAAERRPTMETILGFVPTGEPDAPFDSYREHL